MEARRYWGLAGLVCVGLGVALGELVAAFASPTNSPVSAVGQGVISLLPGPVSEWAIHLLGSNDKTVFLGTMAAVMAVLAVASGLLERRRRGLGQMLVALFGVLGIAVLALRPDVGGVAFVAPVVAVLAAMVLLAWTARRFLRRPQALTTAAPQQDFDPTRRRFLAWMGAGAALAAIGAGAAVAVRHSAVLVAGIRDSLHLPMPVTAAPPIPAAAQLGIAGITPLVTPTDSFYRIDTALVVPIVDPDTWTLKVTGLVERELTLTFAQLLAKPMTEAYVTIGCVSNEVGGPLVGNARWLGWPVRELLKEAGVRPGADMVLSRSTDGFTAGTPLEAMTDARNALIAVGMDGQPLPLEHGFPVRLIVPGLYGYVSATKWLSELKVTTFAADQGYWTPLGWSPLGPIKTASRIDVPRARATVVAGGFTAAGVAWSPHAGISAVQIKLDDGPWQGATLAEALNKDTWVQWQAPLNLTPGRHELAVRAVTADGVVQTSAVAPPAPNGASGYDTAAFTAR